MKDLVVFAKHWEAGTAKTRLGASIGPVQSSEIYRCFVETTLERFRDMADRRTVAYSPPEAHAAFRQLIGDRNWQLRPQASGDLGRRLDQDVATSFRAGAKALVVIGSDSPSLPLEYVERAYSGLQTHDVVLGPTDDGGYYLIGLRRPLPEVFRGIPWSTPHVLERTCENLRAMPGPVTCQLLSRWFDVDRLADLILLGDQLSGDPGLDPPLRALSEQVRHVLRR